MAGATPDACVRGHRLQTILALFAIHLQFISGFNETGHAFGGSAAGKFQSENGGGIRLCKRVVVGNFVMSGNGDGLLVGGVASAVKSENTHVVKGAARLTAADAAVKP